MTDDLSPARPALQELESRAKSLQRAVLDGHEATIDRLLKRLPKLTSAEIQGLTLDRARTAVARECGFRTWQMAFEVFGARLKPGDDFGEFWYEIKTDVLLNHWCRNYQEALHTHEQQGGFLVPYKRQFVVVQKTYIEILEMDPDDSAWQAIGYDLAQPADLTSYGKLVFSRLKKIGSN